MHFADLDPAARRWVESTLASLTPEEMCAQVIFVGGGSDDAAVEELARRWNEWPCGGIFTWTGTMAEHRRRLQKLQEAVRIPLLVAADLECGPAAVVDAPQFPDTLALGAAGRPEWAQAAAECAARYARACGINWTFAPVVDLNLNPDNPIANTRAYGDNPEQVIPLAAAYIRGAQEHGLAACAKHFPGDGVDDVDQHITTSVNSLPLDAWQRQHGRVFAAMFREGVASVMIGHIAFPALDPSVSPGQVPTPATLSSRITTGLLRQEMGYRGLVTSDDVNMGGVAGCYSRPERIRRIFAAGCDVILLGRLPEDRDALLEGLRSGEISEERLRESVRRILELKAQLGLHRGDLFREAPPADERRRYEETAERIARAAVQLVRDEKGILPLRNLRPGARVLTVTLAHDGRDLPVVDAELRSRGFRVEHLVNPADFNFARRTAEYDAIFLNLKFKATWCVSTVRCVGMQNLMFMDAFYRRHPAAVCTSFGSPYHLRVLRNLPTYVNVYSDSEPSQRAAVAAWLGEIPFTNNCPVATDRLFSDYARR